MNYEFEGKTLLRTIRKAVQSESAIHCTVFEIERKRGLFSVLAPPLIWGPWVEIWVQFGVTGPNRDNHVTFLDISYETVSNLPSPFEVEISGGDRFISSTGPGSETVTISGNVATAVSIRCRSFSIGQNISVQVR